MGEGSSEKQGHESRTVTLEILPRLQASTAQADFLFAALPDREHGRKKKSHGTAQEAYRGNLGRGGGSAAREQESFVGKSWSPENHAQTKIHGGHPRIHTLPPQPLTVQASRSSLPDLPTSSLPHLSTDVEKTYEGAHKLKEFREDQSLRAPNERWFTPAPHSSGLRSFA